MTIQIRNMWLEEKSCQGTSEFHIKVEGLRDQGTINEWKMDINSTFWIMFDGLVDFTLCLSIWGRPSTKFVKPWAKKPWAKKPWLANFFF